MKSAKKTYSFRLSADAVEALDRQKALYGSRTGVIEYWAYRSVHGEGVSGKGKEGVLVEPNGDLAKEDLKTYMGNLPAGWKVREDGKKKWVLDNNGQVQKILVEGRDF